VPGEGVLRRVACRSRGHESHRPAALRADLPGARQRLPTPEDLEAVCEPLGAVVLELPAREIGGQLPAWEELTAFCAKARDQVIALHMDGARLWRCAPFYQRTLAGIADLFDPQPQALAPQSGRPASTAPPTRRCARSTASSPPGNLTTFPSIAQRLQGLQSIQRPNRLQTLNFPVGGHPIVKG
jgi:hypothetical protein